MTNTAKPNKIDFSAVSRPTWQEPVLPNSSGSTAPVSSPDSSTLTPGTETSAPSSTNPSTTKPTRKPFSDPTTRTPPPLPPWCPSLRDSQSTIIPQLVSAFDSGVRVALLDAPTGYGKTLTAEMVRRTLGARALYVCSSLTLQAQFANDFPEASILMGRSNYPTLDYADDFDDPFAPITAADCDKQEGICSYCSFVPDCPYERAKSSALRSNLTCTNTAYFLTEANGPGRFSGWPLVIIDEADKLEDQLLKVIEVNVPGRLIQSLHLPRPRLKTKEVAWTEWCDDVAPTIRRYAETFQPTSPKNIRQRTRFTRLSKRLATVAREIEQGGWVYEERRDGTVNFKPVRVTNWADDLLWRHGQHFILMSGTLIPPEIISSLNPPGPTISLEAPSSFPVERRPIRIVGVAPMAKKLLDDSLPKMGLALHRILGLHPTDRILVHTHTFATAQYLYDNLDKSRLITYSDSSTREAALRRYRATPNAVLLAPSMGRGIDLPDDECRVVVVAKIPYPDLGDKQVNARLYEPGQRRAGEVWYATNTLREVIQMLGRGMRHENDTCTHYILDSMFYKLHREWGFLIPKWIKDALEWGGRWKTDITQGIN